MLDSIPIAALAGDQGMVNLMAAGEPERSQRALEDLLRRVPALLLGWPEAPRSLLPAEVPARRETQNGGRSSAIEG